MYPIVPHAAVRATALIFVGYNFASETFVVFSSRSMLWGSISKFTICVSQLRCRYSIPQAAPREIWYIFSQLKEVFPSPGKTHLSSDSCGINSYTRARFDPLVEKNILLLRWRGESFRLLLLRLWTLGHLHLTCPTCAAWKNKDIDVFMNSGENCGAPLLSSANTTFSSIPPKFKSLNKPFADVPIGKVSVISYRKWCLSNHLHSAQALHFFHIISN